MSNLVEMVRIIRKYLTKAREHDRRTAAQAVMLADERLSPPEQQVCSLIAAVCSNKEIAAKMDVTEGTIKDHIHSIKHKMGFHNRTEIAIWWVEVEKSAGACATAGIGKI